MTNFQIPNLSPLTHLPFLWHIVMCFHEFSGFAWNEVSKRTFTVRNSIPFFYLCKITEKTVTYHDGLKIAYKPTKYVDDCRIQWIQSNTSLNTIPNSKSSFPHFIPSKSREVMKTHYYIFRFYECRMNDQFPYQFNFLILPGQLEFIKIK